MTGYFTPVTRQSLQIREAILKAMLTARLTQLRVFAQSITSIATTTSVQTSPLFFQLTGYSDVPKGYQPGKGFDFQFMQFPSAEQEEVETIETDVLIIGSGCGGSAAAKNLAEAGHKVLVVDKSYYFPPSQLPMPQKAALEYLYERRGFIRTEDSGLNIVAGSCWGGGGSVNWGVCLQPQDFVREQWAEEHGLPFFTTPEFQDCLDRVSDFMAAGSGPIHHNQRNQALLDGSRKLGWKAADAPQNCGSGEHECGQCHLGCYSTQRRSTVVSWLPEAVKAGAKCVEGFRVDRILLDAKGENTSATGVEGEWISRDSNGGVDSPLDERVIRKVIITAKKVILAGGTLNSPLVLTRSGIAVGWNRSEPGQVVRLANVMQNRHIGQNLHLHPANFVHGVYDQDTEPWKGIYKRPLLVIQPGSSRLTTHGGRSKYHIILCCF
jgi:choline dehydrogenase-like flavoprotein